MDFKDIKDAVLDGRRLEKPKAHEELLWYQLREIQAAKKNLMPPDKIAERERQVKLGFALNSSREEIAGAAIEKINELRVIVSLAADRYMKNRSIETADELIKKFYNLPRFGEGAEDDGRSPSTENTDKQ